MVYFGKVELWSEIIRILRVIHKRATTNKVNCKIANTPTLMPGVSIVLPNKQNQFL